MKLSVGKVYVNDKKYVGCRDCKKKECTCGKHNMGEITFQTYSTKVDDEYYNIKGWGAKNVKEGDTIEGELESKEFNGKVYKTIVLPKPDPNAEIAELKKEIENMKSDIFALNQAVFSRDESPIPEEEFDPAELDF